MRFKKIKFLDRIIDSKNMKETTKFCRKIAIKEGKELEYALKLYNFIKTGKAKIYIYENGKFEYKRVK